MGGLVDLEHPGFNTVRTTQMAKNNRKINRANHGKRPSGGHMRRKLKGKAIRTS